MGSFGFFRSNCFGNSDKERNDTGITWITDRAAEEVVFEYFWEQKSQSEIAEKLGVSHAAVSKILTRAINRLRKKMYGMERGCIRGGKTECEGKSQKREKVMY